MRNRMQLKRHDKGFSLVELMVAVVIGLIGVIAMFQVLSIWDKMKRTTSAGSDAQVAGTVGFYRLEHDIKQAGMGFGAAKNNVMGCEVDAVVNATAGSATWPKTNARSAFTFPLVPMVIDQGAGSAPDTISVFYGNSAYFVAEQPFRASTQISKETRSRHGFKVGDAVIVTNNAASLATAKCVLMEVTGDSNVDGLTLDHTTGSRRYNRATGSDPTAGAAFSTGLLFNMGPRPQRNIWQVTNDALTLTDALVTNTAATVADGIIDIQAQYGIDTDTPPDYKVDTWQDTDPADWTRLLAVRVAMLARSQQYERTTYDGANPVYVTPDSKKPVLPWKDSGGNAIYFRMNDIGGSADTNPKDDKDWRNYRYRVYSGVISLRNAVWGMSP